MDRQVFQTDNKSRWRKFKWSIALICTMVGLLFAVFVVMLIMDRIPSMPFHEDYSTAIMASKPYMKGNRIAREYKSFRQYFGGEKKSHSNYARWAAVKKGRMSRFDGNTNRYVEEWTSAPSGIRAAFYVAWDPQSYVSLKGAVKSLNLVIPEWCFVSPKDGSLAVNIDRKGYKLMQQAGIPVMPMLSNAHLGEFSSKGTHQLLHSGTLRAKLIGQLVDLCRQHHFVGINVDFEELGEPTNEPLTAFIRELSYAFHQNGLYLSQDVEPNNEDYDLAACAKYDDYVVCMAYDEHNTMSGPGPVSSQQWISKTMDDITEKIPAGKIILGVAAYGYDWTPRGDNNQSVDYETAISTASDTQSPITFDNNTYSLSYAYNDNSHTLHQVYLNDAATNFNTMRFGCEYGVAGFGVWRLGSEDKRLWSFYGKDMTKQGTTHIRIGDLEMLEGSKTANYLGEGEVLDIISTPHDGRVDIEMDNDAQLIAEEYYRKIPSGYGLQKFGHCGPKELLLTFDDGPDSRWTPKILSTLKKYGVQAAFFMVGLQMEKNLPVVKEVYDDGHIIGNHTFTHRNVATNSPQRTYMELRLTRLLIESCTGSSTILFRAPYNADSDPSGSDELIPLNEARKQNFIDVGESIDPNDWMPGITADEIFGRVVKGVEHGDGHIILLHDAGGDSRQATVDALPRIISYLQHKGYRFITLPEYLDKPKAELMPPIPHGKEYYAMQANLTLAELIYNFNNCVAAMFVLFIILGVGRLIFMCILVAKERRNERRLNALALQVHPDVMPEVAIIVPAYNEEVNAVASLRNLLRQDYPNFHIVFVDDGSKDSTFERVSTAFKDHPMMTLLSKPNGGKASALNYGIAHTDADFVVCMDADTKLKPDAVSILMRHFFIDEEGRVGAVAGNVKVGNQRNLLTRWQAIEYTTSQNFDRMAYSAINAITVVPGAIGAFRKSAIQRAGGLTTDTLAEDCDLTIRILKAGYRVENEDGAIALTEAPERLPQFIKQRVRWCFGIMQTFWKNRSALFSRRYKGLGLWALPNMLIFQFIIPTFSPIADVLMIAGLFTGNAGKVLLYYLIFLLVDASISIMAYLHEDERLWVLLLIIPQRLCYRWIMYVVLFKSYLKAVKGELQSWGVLKRTGNVGEV
ncbi:MAG: glycosyltransferase [Prevotella sp.]|nr:glycosyltransferase [Prevotella sp.]